ncbi:MAG: TolC family protein [Spirochaetes bacterium]|mgnify:CR=1 FL=1|nr:TolC family protein [Spirochaetota bacterium]
MNPFTIHAQHGTPRRRSVSHGLICAVILLAAGASPARADTRDLPKELNESTGVTRADVERATAKKELSLFDAYALTLGGAEKVAITHEDYVQALARRRQAIGSFLPRVSLKAQKMFPDNDPANRTTYYGTGVNLYARQPILTGLDEWATLKLARTDLALKKNRIAESASNLLLDVARAFYRLIQVEKGIANRETTIALHRKMLAELNRRVALGRSRRSEVLRTLSQVAKLEAEIKSQKNELARARLDFAAVTNIPAGRDLADYAHIADPAAPVEPKAALARRWDVKSSEREEELARARLLAARGGHLPSVYLEGNYRLYQLHEQGTRDYYFALGAELPIFTGGITSARVSEAESLVKQAGLRKSLVARTAEQDIADAVQSFESTRGECEAFRKALESAESNYAVTLNEYRLSLVTILDVITSLTFLQAARDDYDRVLLQHRLDRVRLGIATGEFNGAGIAVLRDAAVEQKRGEAK